MIAQWWVTGIALTLLGIADTTLWILGRSKTSNNIVESLERI
jgi:hypothetical protein